MASDAVYAPSGSVCGGADRTSENTGDLTHAVVLLLGAGEGHTVFGLELAVGSRLRRHLRTLRQVRCCTSDLNPPPHALNPP